MAYRAHITVTDPNTGKTLGATRLDAELAGLLGTNVVRRGTRHGRVGLWLERDSKSSFEGALDTVARYFVTTGYSARFDFTNNRSFTHGFTFVRFWNERTPHALTAARG